MVKEIVHYIKNTHKVQIDDSNYDKYNVESKVDLKDNGPFNCYDYMYVNDFSYGLSWEGSYVEDLEEEGLIASEPMWIRLTCYFLCE